MKRRHFIKASGIAAAVNLQPFPLFAFAAAKGNEFVSQRPALNDRKFVSEAVERQITAAKQKIRDKELAWLFENCYPNTLDTTVTATTKNGRPDTYVITGDIDAMWLRDSSAQVWPYLPLMKEDKKLQNAIAGVVNRHAFYVLVDPYANAFYNDPTRKGHNDKTEMKPYVHERKWEIDSLCYPIRLGYHYWKTTGDTNPFGTEWKKSIETIHQVFREQQRKSTKGPYHFQRTTPHATDTQLILTDVYVRDRFSIKAHRKGYWPRQTRNG